jgi:hypothetical protein
MLPEDVIRLCSLPRDEMGRDRGAINSAKHAEELVTKFCLELDARVAARTASAQTAATAASAQHVDSALMAEDVDEALEATLPTNGGRVVINCRPLNASVRPWPFHMMTLSSLLAAIRPGGYLAKVDLRAGYYHIRVAPSAFKYFAFVWRGAIYCFKRLCMGLSSAPAGFSWLTGELNEWLRAAGFRACIVYIDDFLIYAHSKEEADAALAFLRAALAKLNIQVAEDKSDTESAQRKSMLGVTIDTTSATCAINPEMMTKTFFYVYLIRKLATRGLRVRFNRLQTLAGCLVHIAILNPFITPHTRVFAALSFSAKSYHMVAISAEMSEAVSFLALAAETGMIRGQSLLPSALVRPSRTLYFTSDASGKTGNVSLSLGPSIRVFVEMPRGRYHDVVLLEFLAALAVTLTLGPYLPGAILVHGIDNAAAVEYGNRGRSGRRDILDLLKVLFASAEEHSQCLLFRWYSRWINHRNDRIAAASDVVAARAAGATHFIRLDGPLREALTPLIARLPLSRLPANFALSLSNWAENAAPHA